MCAALAVAVVYHELVCEDGQLISEEVDRALEKYPLFTYSFITITAAHLLNQIPPKLDPYTWIFTLVRKFK